MANPASGTSSPIVVDGLTNGLSYRARVRAVNASGAGPWSALSAGFVPAPVETTPSVVGSSGGSISGGAVWPTGYTPTTGHYAVLAVFDAGSTAAASGWALLSSTTDGNTSAALYGKALTAGEGLPTLTGDGGWAMTICSNAVGVENPISSGTASGTTHTFATGATTGNRKMLSFIGSDQPGASAVAAPNFTPPSGWTERRDAQGTNNVSVGSADIDSTGAKAAGSITWTSNFTGPCIGFVVGVSSTVIGGSTGGGTVGQPGLAPDLDLTTFTTAGALAPFTHRAASTTTSTFADTTFPLTVQTSGHYAARVPDPAGLSRDVVVLNTDERIGTGSGGAVRTNLYAQTAAGWTDGAVMDVLGEVYFPTDFPDLGGAPDGNSWMALMSLAPRGLIGSGATTISMLYRNGRNELTWIGEDLAAVPQLWNGTAATRGVWHVILCRTKLTNAGTDGWFEIWYGRRAAPALGLAALPLTLQTLNVATGVQYANSNTRRINFKTLSDSSISPNPGPPWTMANYHADSMPAFEAKVMTPIYQTRKVWQDIRVGDVKQIDPYYTTPTPLWNGDTWTLVPKTITQGGEGSLDGDSAHPWQWSSAWNSGLTPQFRPHSNTDPTVHGSTVVDDPTGLIGTAAPWVGQVRKTIKNRNVEGSYVGSGYSRMDCRGPENLQNGDYRWLYSEIFIPATFPTFPTSFPFWNILEMFGSPYNGTAPSSLFLRRNLAGDGLDIVWESGSDVASNIQITRYPVTKGRWHILLRKIKFSTDPAVGFSELYHSTRNADGTLPGPVQIQTMTSGGVLTLVNSNTRRMYATLATRASDGASINGTGNNHVELKNYHSAGLVTAPQDLYWARTRLYDGNEPVERLDPYYTGLV